MIFKEILVIITAYLLGAVPFAYIFARLIKGIDIRQAGTHNAGAMNVVEQIGLIPGVAVLLLDIGKGSLAVFLARWLEVPDIVIYLAGLAAVAGHTWPVYLRFKGGKGAATTIGVLWILAPLEFSICLAIIVAIFFATHDTGSGMAVGLILLPLLLWIFGEDRGLIFFSLAMALFLLVINSQMLRQDISQAGGFKEYLRAKRPKR